MAVRLRRLVLRPEELGEQRVKGLRARPGAISLGADLRGARAAQGEGAGRAGRWETDQDGRADVASVADAPAATHGPPTHFRRRAPRRRRPPAGAARRPRRRAPRRRRATAIRRRLPRATCRRDPRTERSECDPRHPLVAPPAKWGESKGCAEFMISHRTHDLTPAGGTGHANTCQGAPRCRGHGASCCSRRRSACCAGRFRSIAVGIGRRFWPRDAGEPPATPGRFRLLRSLRHAARSRRNRDLH